MHAAEVLQQPRVALPHDDHFHVRIGCPSGMSGCVENPVARGRRPASSETRLRAHTGEAADLPSVHGRRPGASRALVTPPPSRAHPPPSETEAAPPDELQTGEPSREPDAPPASVPAALDDVDG
jgi:hypothetical protein